MCVNQGLSVIMSIRWPNIISNTAELWDATRDKPTYNATNENEKIAMDRLYSGEGV